MTADKIKYYDASPNPDHLTKEQIERVVTSLSDEGDVCRDCGNTPETGACFTCKMD